MMTFAYRSTSYLVYDNSEHIASMESNMYTRRRKNWDLGTKKLKKLIFSAQKQFFKSNKCTW